MKKLMSLILIGFAATALFAQNTDSKSEAKTENSEASSEVIKLSIDEAVEYALKNSVMLKSNDIALELKKRANSYSWNVFIPDVSASGTMSRANEFNPGTAATNQLMNQLTRGQYPAKTSYTDEESRWTTLGTVAVSWALTPMYIANIKVAKANYEEGLANWDKTQKQIVTNIKKAYYGLLLQQENLKIKKNSLENKRQRMIQAQTNFKNGAIPEIQLLQAQVNYENSKPDVDSTEQAYIQQTDLFEYLIGMPLGTKIEFTDSIEAAYVDVEADELLAKYSENNLEIQAKKKTMETAKIGLTYGELSTWLPTLALKYSWNPVYIGSEGAWHFYKDLGSDEKWYDSGTFSATLVWNLTNMLPWSSNRQKLKDSKQQIAILELEIQRLKENQKVEVRKAVDTLKQARQQIDSMGRNVTLAQKSYDMTIRSYRGGTSEFLAVKDSEEALDTAKLGLINQKFQYISALMDLENTLNVKLTEDKQ